MTDSLVPVLLLLVVAAGLAGVLLLLSTYLGRPRRSTVDTTPYECGAKPFEPVESHRFSVKFYLVAMLFILFDIEIVFMYPWAVVYRDFIVQHGTGIFWSMLSFVGILTVGYVYAIMKGALDWKR